MDILLFNPNAGSIKRLGLTIDLLVSKLVEKGINPLAPHSHIEEERMIAAVKAPGRVIVAGGDGTIHDLLKAAGDCNTLELAIIPMGTANHFASALGIPTDVDEAIDVIAAGRTRRVDLGKANGTVFSQAAGVGLHAKVFELYGKRVDKSPVEAAKAGMSALDDWRPSALEIEIDGEPYEGEVTQVTAANTPMYGARFMVAPDARLDDGLLDVVIVGGLTKLEIVQYAIAMMSGSHVQLPKTYTTRARKISVRTVSGDPVEVHADAEPIGQTPVDIEILPDCLEVVVPEEMI